MDDDGDGASVLSIDRSSILSEFHVQDFDNLSFCLSLSVVKLSFRRIVRLLLCLCSPTVLGLRQPDDDPLLLARCFLQSWKRVDKLFSGFNEDCDCVGGNVGPLLIPPGEIESVFVHFSCTRNVPVLNVLTSRHRGGDVGGF